jgi:hypothetical protein
MYQHFGQWNCVNLLVQELAKYLLADLVSIAGLIAGTIGSIAGLTGI